MQTNGRERDQMAHHRPIPGINIDDRETRAPTLSWEPVMALHYFHISNGHTTLDDRGTDLPALADVRRVAVHTAHELLNLGNDDHLWTSEPWRVWVTDQPDGGGLTIASIEVIGS